MLQLTKRTSIHLDSTPRGSWASSIFDLNNSEGDAPLPRLLEHTPVERQDSINEDVRSQSRQPDLFCLYPGVEEVSKVFLGRTLFNSTLFGNFSSSAWESISHRCPNLGPVLGLFRSYSKLKSSHK